MEKGVLKIEDESGDRKYFTIIPNYILNHSTLWDREVYIQIKRIAGETGTCWTSRNTLAKQCGMSVRRLQKSLKYLTKHGWIVHVGGKKVPTNGGLQEMNEYKIADLWKLNVGFYEAKGGAPKTPPSDKKSQRGCTDKAKGGASYAPKEEPIQEELRESGVEAPQISIFNSLETRKRWKEGKNRPFRILNWFFEKKGIWEKIQNQNQLDLTSKRHLRAATQINTGGWLPKDLEPIAQRLCEDEKMRDAWTLETILKNLTK